MAFQNGKPFNADAVVTAFNYLLTTDTPSRSLTVENVAAIEAADEYTVVIRTVETDILMPNRLTSPNLAVLVR